MRILVLGVSGMLGNAVFRLLAADAIHDVIGTLRNPTDIIFSPPPTRERIITGIDVLDNDILIHVLSENTPDVVVNCVGLVKQLASAKDPLVALPVNALYPHRLANLCRLAGSRMIHISTDCVFSGRKGNYTENDITDAEDLYGKSKQLGEVADQRHVLTIRTSIIGHELHSNHALVNWFLSSENQIKGFTRAIFSGLPTIELARIIRNYILPDDSIHGLYHVSAEPITKHDLLKLISAIYDKQIKIFPNEELVIDRSLNSERFSAATGYRPPAWPDLIRVMHEDYLQTKGLKHV